jgi:hypothetical protein
VQRQYTLDQLNQAAAAAKASGDAGTGVFANFTIDSVAPVTTDFDGITVTGQHKSNPADTNAADAALSQQATQALGVAVKVKTTAMSVAFTQKRNDDASPFKAGGFMAYGRTDKAYINPTAYCSTGFALTIGSAHYTTTARHCYGSAYHSIDSSAQALSTYSVKQKATDGAALVLTAGGERSMFYGGYTSSLKARVVADPKTNSGANIKPGDIVCTSGGNSGTHCGGGANIKVLTTGITKNDCFPGQVSSAAAPCGNFSAIMAKRIDGGLAGVSGDSGGPVYRNKTSTDVYAVGMIQIGDPDSQVPCGSTRVKPDNCASLIYYTSINTIIRGVPGSSLYHW